MSETKIVGFLIQRLFHFHTIFQKTPFAGTDVNSDLGKFYRDCQTAPSLQFLEDDQTAQRALEQLTTQLDMFETSMKDFDEFVSTLQTDSDNECVARETDVDQCEVKT